MAERGEQARLALYALNHARLSATNAAALAADPPAERVLVAVFALYDHEPSTPGFATALHAVRKALE